MSLGGCRTDVRLMEGVVGIGVHGLVRMGSGFGSKWLSSGR